LFFFFRIVFIVPIVVFPIPHHCFPLLFFNRGRGAGGWIDAGRAGKNTTGLKNVMDDFNF
jgi:hypothetical protein